MQTKRSASQPRTVFSAVRRRSARMAVVATLCLGLAPFASPVRADTYKIDPDHTEVRFTNLCLCDEWNNKEYYLNHSGLTDCVPDSRRQ